jgi:inner membrane transporter RhtA
VATPTAITYPAIRASVALLLFPPPCGHAHGDHVLGAPPGRGRSRGELAGTTARRRHPPPHVYFVVSAVFHYLGPAFAVLLFARVEPLGVAWLRIARLPLGTVAAVEFLPVIAVALIGTRTVRNLLALALAVGGVCLLSDVRLLAQPLGFAFAAANAPLFAVYIVLGHRVAQSPQAASTGSRCP